MRDTRRASRRFFEVAEVRDTRAPVLIFACLVVAALAAFLPAYPGLEAAPRWKRLMTHPRAIMGQIRRTR